MYWTTVTDVSPPMAWDTGIDSSCDPTQDGWMDEITHYVYDFIQIDPSEYRNHNGFYTN